VGFARNLKQDVTHWPVTGTDGYGGFTFGAPVLLKGRWEDKQELFINQDSETVLSQAIAYFNTDLESGDYLALGDFAEIDVPILDPSALDAFRIRNYSKVTDLGALVALRKVWL
jgi:hypothetical protein